MIIDYIHENCTTYNLNLKTYLIDFFNYILLKKKYALNHVWMNSMQYIIHNNDVEDQYILDYFIDKFIELYQCNKEN